MRLETVAHDGVLHDASRVCRVKLFNYPVVCEDAPSRAYCGHSSHVMGVRFSADDKYVVSAGGKDRALLQWRTQYVAAWDPEPPPSPKEVSLPGYDFAYRLLGHSSTIRHFDFSRDSSTLQSSCAGYELLYASACIASPVFSSHRELIAIISMLGQVLGCQIGKAAADKPKRYSMGFLDEYSWLLGDGHLAR